MDHGSDILPWLSAACGVLVAAVVAALWVTSQISRSRHQIRNEITAFRLELEADDRDQERRFDRRMDELTARVTRLEERRGAD